MGAVSLGGAFVSLEISSSFLIYFSLFSFILAWTFISLQIKEFRIVGLSINDSVYSCLFFFLTGLHFFHLLLGVVLQGLFFWGCSFSVKNHYFVTLRVSEILLFYNLQLFYWHFLEILWLFIFLFLFLHLGRAISYGSYFYNPNTWFSGIILFFFLMLSVGSKERNFTSYEFRNFITILYFLFIILFYTSLDIY